MTANTVTFSCGHTAQRTHTDAPIGEVPCIDCRRVLREAERSAEAEFIHVGRLCRAIERLRDALNCGSIPAEMRPHLTAAQRDVLRDTGRWAYDMLEPVRIAPAKAWRTPTEVRAAVTANLKARSDQGIERKENGAVNVRRRRR